MSSLDKSIEDIISELNVTIIYKANLEKLGYYVASMNIIVLNSNQTEFELTKTLLHELGHAANHQGNQLLYQATYTMHSKMENEAEEFMAKHLVRQYMEIHDADPKAINYINFIYENQIDVTLAPKVKEWFLEYSPY